MKDDANYVGQVFGRLTVLSQWREEKVPKLECRCECGNVKIFDRVSVKRGRAKSCGCLQRDNAIKANTKHGCAEHRSTEYNIWAGIVQRCTNPNSNAYRHYGARGIKMCERWRNSFEAFREDVGLRPSKKHSIDRIDNNGNYEPGNVKWSTQKEQCRNTRWNRVVTLNGESRTLVEWCETLKVNYRSVYWRMEKNGLTIEDALLLLKETASINKKQNA